MANEQNLKPLTTSKAREIGKKGGKRSAEIRKEKKMLRDLLEEALEKETETGNKYIDITIALITFNRIPTIVAITLATTATPIKNALIGAVAGEPVSSFPINNDVKTFFRVFAIKTNRLF